MTESDNNLKESVLNKIKVKIFNLEHSNHNAKNFSTSEMVQKIRKIIDEMVRAEDNL